MPLARCCSRLRVTWRSSVNAARRRRQTLRPGSSGGSMVSNWPAVILEPGEFKTIEDAEAVELQDPGRSLAEMQDRRHKRHLAIEHLVKGIRNARLPEKSSTVFFESNLASPQYTIRPCGRSTRSSHGFDADPEDRSSVTSTTAAGTGSFMLANFNGRMPPMFLMPLPATLIHPRNSSTGLLTEPGVAIVVPKSISLRLQGDHQPILLARLVAGQSCRLPGQSEVRIPLR